MVSHVGVVLEQRLSEKLLPGAYKKAANLRHHQKDFAENVTI